MIRTFSCSFTVWEQMDQKREKYHRVRSNYETMQNMAERYDGYGFGIKKVMEQQAVTSGIIGAVADIIKVEEKYETAIETASSLILQLLWIFQADCSYS